MKRIKTIFTIQIRLLLQHMSDSKADLNLKHSKLYINPIHDMIT